MKLKLKCCFYWIIAWPAIIMFALLRGERKNRLLYDIQRFSRRRFGRAPKSYILDFYKLLLSRREFRNVFYMRCGNISSMIKWLLPGMPTLELATRSCDIESGLFIEHGWAMVLDAEHVGKNLWINQGVTVGWGRNGHPTIGDNVRIGTGAVVIGGITIGDNVNIGANAIVVENVPANCTVCSPKASIVKYHTYPTMNASLCESAMSPVVAWGGGKTLVINTISLCNLSVA